MKYADQVMAGRGIPCTYRDPPEKSGLLYVLPKSMITGVMSYIFFLIYTEAGLDTCLILAQVNTTENIPSFYFQSWI